MPIRLLRQALQAEIQEGDVRLAAEAEAVRLAAEAGGVGTESAGTGPADTGPAEVGHWACRVVAHYNNTWVGRRTGPGRDHCMVATRTVGLVFQYLSD
jgi:hypothetical protein